MAQKDPPDYQHPAATGTATTQAFVGQAPHHTTAAVHPVPIESPSKAPSESPSKANSQPTKLPPQLLYAKARRLSKLKSLWEYLLQGVLCFLILGPMLSLALMQAIQYLWPQFPSRSPLPMEPQQLADMPNFWGLLWGTPLGFALSLAIDWRKAPLVSCLPLAQIRRKTLPHGREVQVHNRTFFGQPSKSRIFCGRRRSIPFWCMLSLGLGALVILASNLLLLLLGYLFPELPTFQTDDINLIFASYSPVQVFLLVVVSPAIFEELVFRGRGFALLARSWGGAATVALSSLVFVLVHASPTEVLSLLPLAFYLGWLRLRSGSLGFTMLVHLQNNGLAFLWQLLMGS